MLLRIAIAALLALSACSNSDAASTNDNPAVDTSGWRMASGKEPTKAEFAALAATCEDQVKGGSVDLCLADLGLKRVQ
jgi:hypothetical protein